MDEEDFYLGEGKTHRIRVEETVTTSDEMKPTDAALAIVSSPSLLYLKAHEVFFGKEPETIEDHKEMFTTHKLHIRTFFKHFSETIPASMPPLGWDE